LSKVLRALPLAVMLIVVPNAATWGSDISSAQCVQQAARRVIRVDDTSAPQARKAPQYVSRQPSRPAARPLRGTASPRAPAA
jgi:hypothetical protein